MILDKINQFFQCGLCKSSTCITVHRLFLLTAFSNAFLSAFAGTTYDALYLANPSDEAGMGKQSVNVKIRIEAEAGMVYQEYDGKFKLALRNKLMNVRVLVLTAMAV
ncbi:hypothetical protein GQX74_012678 [Glossina fuscipes]|nr:hypothetical protein GQX74_012678 [Glossina fuscipes]